MNFGGTFDIPGKLKRLEQLDLSAENPDVWNNHREMQKLNEERSQLLRSVESFQKLDRGQQDAVALLELVAEERDDAVFQDLKADLLKLESQCKELELAKMLSQELDPNNAYLSINSGAGGTEACDWASMLLRMYIRYCEKQGFRVEMLDSTPGDAAGIKSATLLVQGPYAYGLLKAESGVHRLVRISPFDSNARRHTSFASVFAWAEISDEIVIEVKPEEIRIDTYRASGAGGQHINKTDSAVRITHIPTGIVIQCQNQRSQHANRDAAMKMLKAALYEREIQERNKAQEEAHSKKKAVEWGSQIRSYVLHPYQLVKDHRMDFETSDVGSVLDGDLNPFIHAYLKMGTATEAGKEK